MSRAELARAWSDDDAAEVYADLDEAGRIVRDAAAEAVNAANSAELWEMVQEAVTEDYDELESLQSWLADPAIWPTR